MSDKKRVDVALVERGLAQSREKAQALVMSLAWSISAKIRWIKRLHR